MTVFQEMLDTHNFRLTERILAKEDEIQSLKTTKQQLQPRINDSSEEADKREQKQQKVIGELGTNLQEVEKK